MRRFYLGVRLAGYAFGLSGAALILAGRMTADPAAGNRRAEIGFVLLVAMFLFFVVSYGIYIAAKFGRRRDR